MKHKKTKEVCIGLEFGTLLNVQFEGVGSAKTSIIGLERDKFLIIKPPALSGLEAKLFQKNQTVVTYLHEGTVYGFRCTLIGLIKAPFPLLILSYPEASEELNLRKHERLSCILNGQLLMDPNPFAITIRDISLSGCRLTIPDPSRLPMALFSMGRIITFTVDMEGEISETVTFVATVKNLQLERNGLMIGAEFIDIANQIDIRCMDKLKRYIAVARESIPF